MSEQELRDDLRIVLDLARQSKLQDHQIDDECGELAKEKERQEEAISNLEYNYDL